MIQLLEYIGEHGVLSVLTTITFVCIAFRKIYEFVIWGFGEIYNYHKGISKKEKLVETIENLAERIERLEKRITDDNFRERVAKLEERNDKQDMQFKAIDKDLDKIIEGIETMKKDHDRTSVAEIRSLLYSLYNDGIAKGYTTQPAMETFEELSEIYLAKNGNSIFKHHIIPTYRKLKIVDIGANLDIEGVQEILDEQEKEI